MLQHSKNSARFLTSLLLLLATVLAILVAWRIFPAIYTPNLSTNSGFDIDHTEGWKMASQGNAYAITSLSVNETKNSVLTLGIADVAEESWVGIGQQIPVEPNRPYRVSLNYRLAQESDSAAKVILRVLQYDQAGTTIKTDEIPSSDFLIVDITDDNHQPVWNELAYDFTTEKNTVAVEISGGLFGNQATTVEIDNIILKANPNLFSAIWQDSIIKFLAVVLIIGMVYKLERRFFSSIPAKVPVAKMNLQLIVIITVNAVIFLVFAELTALGIYFIRDGKLFYTNKEVYDLIQTENNEEEITDRRIHPYFGYIDRPGIIRKSTQDRWKVINTPQQNINNHGFVSDVDYPFIKSNENQYIIGVVGGSVAEVLAVVGKDKLTEQLQQDDFFEDKEFIVLNFAKGAYKQPQQLLIITYFLAIGQELDMVINIDGFNEITLGQRNNKADFDISMPTKSVMEGLSKLTSQLSVEEVESLSKIKGYEIQLDSLAQKLNNNNIASVNFVLEQYYTFILNKYGEEIKRFDTFESPNFSDTSLLFMKPSDRNLQNQILFGEIAELWAESSTAMHQLLSNRGIVYIHLLQPNQYYSNKQFGDEEIASALNDVYEFKEATEKGYPALIAETRRLESNGVHFYNGVAIFDNEPGIVYIDECCHLTQLGNDLMAEFIANSILEIVDFHDK